MARRTTGTDDGTDDGTDGGSTARNEVLLVGRVAAPAQERELPSGDLLASFRLVVDRPPAARTTTGRSVPVDALECAAWTAGTRRTARGLQPGDVVEVQGSLRRRFWRAGAATASRTEVEVAAVRRLVRAPQVTRRPAGRPRQRPSSGGSAEDSAEDPAGQASGTPVRAARV